jgi:predicted nucleic acid-binding protein
MGLKSIMIVLDTNLLIYAHRSETKENLLAQQAIENAQEYLICK